MPWKYDIMDSVEKVLEAIGIEVEGMVSDSLVAQCPFGDHEHDGDRPGLSVFIDTGHWICFKGCGQGTLETLVAKVNGCDGGEARRLIASVGTSTAWADTEDSIPLLDDGGSVDLGQVNADYQAQSPAKVSAYLLDRGFTFETVVSWGLRYDLAARATVIPTFSLGGELVGVTRRRNPDSLLPRKYMHHPDFKISKHLFGAWQFYSFTGTVVLVEGMLDVIWLHQCGVTAAVGLMGLYCSSSQEQLLRILGTRVILALDSDVAGQEATARLLTQLRNKLSVEVIHYPEGKKDAQDLGREEVVDLFKDTLEVESCLTTY